jgi:hypothetical protein
MRNRHVLTYTLADHAFDLARANMQSAANVVLMSAVRDQRGQKFVLLTGLLQESRTRTWERLGNTIYIYFRFEWLSLYSQSQILSVWTNTITLKNIFSDPLSGSTYASSCAESHGQISRKLDHRFCTWTVCILYVSGSGDLIHESGKTAMCIPPKYTCMAYLRCGSVCETSVLPFCGMPCSNQHERSEVCAALHQFDCNLCSWDHCPRKWDGFLWAHRSRVMDFRLEYSVDGTVECRGFRTVREVFPNKKSWHNRDVSNETIYKAFISMYVPGFVVILVLETAAWYGIWGEPA